MTRLRAALVATLTLTLTLTVLGPPGVGATAARPPVVTPKGASVSERDGRAVVVVSLKAKARKTIRVPFATVAGTAKPGKDFKSTRGTVAIKKGKKSARIPIVILNDRGAEPTERFTVALTDRAAYDLAKRSVTVTIKDDDGAGGGSSGTATDALAKVRQWTGDLTVHVTKHQPSNPTIVDEDWTFVTHLVMKSDGSGSTWLPTSASTWTLQGTITSTNPTGDCPTHPDRKEIDTAGTFMANPFSGFPALGQAQYALRTQVGNQPNVMEAQIVHAAATAYSYWDYTHTCTEHVDSAAEVDVGFQTRWRTMDPVAHPGTFPLTLLFGQGSATRLKVDFTDDYDDPNHAGWTTHSRVTGTLTGS